MLGTRAAVLTASRFGVRYGYRQMRSRPGSGRTVNDGKHCQMQLMRTMTLLALLYVAAPVRAAEFFYLDHDAFSGRYVGPVGPLVLSGDIDAGDYARLLARIAADGERFLSQNAVIVASVAGDTDEAIKIAGLLRSMDSEVTVGTLTGRCSGPCFLIYAAAARGAIDGSLLLGVRAPLPEAARVWLRGNAVPQDLLDELSGGSPDAVHWLSEAEETRLGGRSPAFGRELAERCAWDDAAEREAIAGRRPFRDLEPMWACRTRLTQAAARATLRRLLVTQPDR